MDDMHMLENIRNGDSRAFHTLVIHYQQRVIAIGYRFTHNRDDAEEIAQEVFLQVYRSIGTFRGEAQLFTWIYRIAVGKSLDFLRKRSRKKRFAQLTRWFSTGRTEIELPADTTLHPDRQLEDREARAALNRALDQLPEKQRTALILTKLEGFSSQDAANVMNSSATAVESLVYRGKASLRGILSHYYSNGYGDFSF